jgi:hypothetical protein
MALRRGDADVLIDHLLALTTAELRGLRRRFGFASSQNKGELRDILSAAITNGTLTTAAIIEFLDQVTPWGKQHIFLYRGKSGTQKHWTNRRNVKNTLATHGLLDLLDKQVPLALPKALTLASIRSTSSVLRVTAIRRREGWVRDHDLVKYGKTPDGREVEYRGFVRQVLRGLVAFEWNLVANEAMLQISQLPSGSSYEGVAAEFATIVESWLRIKDFSLIDVRRANAELHKLERAKKAKTTSQYAGFDRVGSRRFTVRSTSNKVPLFGDKDIDDFLSKVEPESVPRIGGYFWGADGKGKDSKRTHFVIVGAKKRVNVMTPSSEERLRNVVTELRRLSK